MSITNERLHALDGLRGFALLLGIALHASMSFVPGLPPGVWSTVDETTSSTLARFFLVTHVFRMTLFFVIAGYFARLLVARRGVVGFWANRATRILLPLLAGWLVLWPAVSAVWAWGLTELFGGKLPPRPASMTPPPGYFPLMHLWFLYYLLLAYAALTIVRAVLQRVDPAARVASALQATFDRLLRAGVAPLVLALPVAAVLYARERWLVWSGIPTPDMTLVPQAPALVAYTMALAVGWALHRAADGLLLAQRRWAPHLAVALISIGWCVVQAGGRFTFVPYEPGATKAITAFAYATGAWSAALALVGLALDLLARESRVRRYLADASYFLYLAHLPVVGALAVVVRHWPVHWSVKWSFVLGATLATLLLVYHVAIRPSFIGRALNGRTVPLRRKSVVREIGRAPARAAGDAIAELRDVRKAYGTRVALADVSLEVRRGELVALLGPNGAGKSTAIGLWLGLHSADAGEVLLAGGSPLDVARRRHMGVMMQDVALAQGMRVRELILQASAAYPAPRTLDETLAMAGVGVLADRRYDKLSGGQKRQVQFALAICGRPSVLFLDEPSVGLDVEAREAMWRTVRVLLREGAAVVLTTHYLEEAEALADRVIVLAHGRVVASGAVDEIRSLVSRREIRCESALDVEALRAWPGVLAARADERSLTLTVTDAETVLRRLLAEDHGLRRLEVRQAGLAEAFAQLTQEAA